jgi:RNA polymerase sigma factor (sigma-70 family)
MIGILKNTADSDAELTAQAIAGHRDAFTQIVMRYQSLVCSLAYSATGSLSRSEDLAQETFIAAWKRLQTLREPEKLRSWLCSIARNIIAGAVRNRKQEPSYSSESIDDTAGLPSSEPLPLDNAISSEEESILWRSLEHIPHSYREPIILFYREGQSVEAVAQALDLSEDAVKQRLARGRKLLKMEVEAFVETALRQSSPGKKFTSAVLAGLPLLSLQTGASTIGVATSKGSAAAKSGSLLSSFAGALTPILGALGGFLSMIGTVKSARSQQEKRLWIITNVVFLCVFISGLAVHLWFIKNERFDFIAFGIQFIAGILVLLAGIFLTKRLRRKIQIEQGQVQEKPDFKRPFGNPESEGFKWNMYASLFGVTFCNPFAFLTVYAASAHDSTVASAIFTILIVTFFFCRRIYLQKQERAIQVWNVIMLAQFPLMLAVLYLRWERWTGYSIWGMKGSDWVLPVVGCLLFVYAIIIRLAKLPRQNSK